MMHTTSDTPKDGPSGESNDGENIEVPHVPDFSRLPFRPAEDAVYRDPDGLPPYLANNPLYLALPGPRTMEEVKKIVRGDAPEIDPAIRSLPAIKRREWIDIVDPIAFPLPRHIRLEDMVMTTIRNSSATRPWNNLYIEESAGRANQIGAKALPHNLRGAVGAGSLFGDVGLGKSLSIVSLLLACPQVIRHRVFRGRRLGIQQVVWLYLSMPPKASTYGLLAWIASILDYMFETSYREDIDSARNHTAQVRVVARALAIHAVGVIFCDEVQNIRVGSKTERKMLENTLQELINYTHTRWVFIGTHDARASIDSAALLRRMCGERGQINWGPLTGLDYDEFLKAMWPLSVTSKQTELTTDIKIALWRITGRVPDYMKRLFTTTQSNIIGNSRYKDEQLLPDVLDRTMRESFPDEYRRFTRLYLLDERRREVQEREAKEKAQALEAEMRAKERDSSGSAA